MEFLSDRLPSEARHWSDSHTLDKRALFDMGSSPGLLVVEKIAVKDRGTYRCRVDFKIQPTTISRVDLRVNSKNPVPRLFSALHYLTLFSQLLILVPCSPS